MAVYKIKSLNNKKIWEDFVLSQNPKSFLQSWNWGETNRLVGKSIYRLGYYNNNKLVGCSLIIKEEAKRGKHFVIPGGPIIDWKDRKLVDVFIKSIKELSKKEGVWFIRVRPEILDNENNRKQFNNLGFQRSPMHLHAENTWVLDIDKSEDDLLYGMRKNTRYSVRKSLKEGLSLDKSKDPSTSTMLYNLQKETIERHGFVGFSKDFFKSQIETFGKDNQALMFTIKKGKIILAASIVIFYGDYAYYHHSGSSTKHQKIPSSYFLQWNIIKEAKKRGKHHYNFWGIAPSDDSNHRFAGVTTFKKGFGGKRVNWLPAHDLPVSKLYYSTNLFEKFRKQKRNL